MQTRNRQTPRFCTSSSPVNDGECHSNRKQATRHASVSSYRLLAGFLLLSCCLGQSCDLGPLFGGGFTGGDVLGFHPDQPPSDQPSSGDVTDNPPNPAGDDTATGVLTADAGEALTVMEGQEVILQGSVSGGESLSLTYLWKQIAGPRVLLMGTSSLTPKFTAPPVLADSVMTFQLTVTAGTTTSSDTIDITVINVLSPKVTLTVSPKEGPAPLQVTFTAKSATISPLPEGTYTWDFGDQTATAEGLSVTHTYENGGTYAARLCLTLPPPQSQEPICAEIPVTVTAAPSGLRQPQWPLKTSRSLYTDEQIAELRRLASSNPTAMTIRNSSVILADPWTRLSNEQLRDLLPDSRVCRDWDVSAKGCPVHGTAVYQYGTYPWKLHPTNRFKVICPVGGEVYPSNDFDAYYRSGMTDSSLLTGKYVDSGRGYVAPNGEKYWFVAYACHWRWMSEWLPAVNRLAQAYALTGKRVYAEKAIVMLDRIAEIYPGMDYNQQSRYAELAGIYKGKILMTVWETFTLRDLAVAYELVFDALVGSTPLSLPWQSSEQIRANIEANLLEEGIDAIARKDIIGNFGMHQHALVNTAIVRQNGPTAALLAGIFTNTGDQLENEGLNYALYNLVYKDGMPIETSPTYCSYWVNAITQFGVPLLAANINLFDDPKVELMLEAPLRMLCTGRFTPANGDAGTIDVGWILPTAAAYEAGYRQFGRPDFAWALQQMGGLVDGFIPTLEGCLQGPLDLAQFESDAASYNHRLKSRLLDGYGLSILNNIGDETTASVYYGPRGGHGHSDRLNIELFAQCKRLSPDLGYPDQMNSLIPGVWGWSKNTVSHNTLLVDDRKQDGNIAGKVLRFHESPTVHAVDIDAAGTYAQADVYRRTLVLVDADDDNSYLVDVFRVRGGDKHVLSIHGPEGQFTMAGTALSAPVTQGTLAGTNVSYGQLYDDPVLGAPGYAGPYYHYNGSGYSHLFYWQHAAPTGPITAQWRTTDNLAGLRVHVPAQTGQDVIVADAYVSPLRLIPTILKYMLVRRSADASGNTFITVWEPTGSQSFIQSISVRNDPSLGQGSDQTIVLSLQRAGATDTIVVSPETGATFTLPSGLSCDSAVAVVTVSNGQLTRGFAAGGTGLTMSQPPIEVSAPATITGSVSAADYDNKTVTVTCDWPATDVQALVGRMVRFYNAAHSCMYQIVSAQASGNTLVLGLGGSEVFTGRVSIRSADTSAGTVTTPTKVPDPSNLAGMRLLTDDLAAQALIVSMSSTGTIQLASGSIMAPFASSLPKDAWIADFGPGDQIEIEMCVHVP
ncbi:MAG: heparinase II/III family protein [Phycisphaerae bacterium]|nr:heparinase II/III family protein [Phycisphaerae bacterium]